MKLLFVEPNPSYGGGSERVCLDLARWLAGRGHAIALLHDADGSMLPAYAAFGTHTRQMALRPFGWRTFGSSLLRARRIGRLARSLGAEVIVASDVHYLRLLALASRFSGVPVAFHLGLPATHDEWSWRRAYRTVAAGIAPSAHTLATWRAARWPAETLSEIPNWVDAERFKPTTDRAALRAQLQLPVDARVIGYVGSLIPEKGIETLLTAFASLQAALSDLLLVLAGKDNVPGDCWAQHATELGIPTGRVRFLGVRRDPEAIMAAADVVVAPSLCEEAFGLTVLEAMACGVPVVTSSVGMFAQILGPAHQDLLTRTGDPADLARGLQAVLADRAAAHARGGALRVRAIEAFGTGPACAAYETILLRVSRN